MDDNLYFIMSIGLRDGSAGEDRDSCHRWLVYHMLEDSGADEARCTRKNKMHFGVLELIEKGAL